QSYQQLPQPSFSVQDRSSSSPIIDTIYTIFHNTVAQKRAIELISNSEKELSELRAMARITFNVKLRSELSSRITSAQKIVEKQEN
ncbi:16845_t:CDS:1, partial [Racocetra fulgida]